MTQKITLRETLIKNNSHAGIEVSGQSIINMTSSKINDNNIGIYLVITQKLNLKTMNHHKIMK